MNHLSAVGRRVDLRRLPIGYLVGAAVLPVILIGLMALVLIARAPASSATAIGSMAPDFTLADLDGNPVRLADFRGRPVIINFWASWCGPCVEEFPLLDDALDRHRASGLAIVGVVYQDGSEAARAFMERTGAPWPATMDPNETVAAVYGILAPPETYFVGRDGTIRARQFGQFSAASLEEKIAAIIDEE